ncbi:hypothetical protein F5Y16DRAFT_145068 [Xylariaceae sp. FL0255]|nr:hypothetical protein F5Y16DRAFT_145068 [Xylariaceae sp. FL0255]
MIQDPCLWRLDGYLSCARSSQGAFALSFEEQATRDRLFWSAHNWNESISLALGREPKFAPRLGRDPLDMIAFAEDDRPWTAYFVNPQTARYNCGIMFGSRIVERLLSVIMLVFAYYVVGNGIVRLCI